MSAGATPMGFTDGADRALELLLAANLPPKADAHLREAGYAYADGEAAEWHLYQAGLNAPAHPAVLIAYYRFYFYKGRLNEALAIAELCIEKVARDLNLPLNWRKLQASHARFGDFAAVLPRFLMFSLKGWAYLQLRRGERAAAIEVLGKLLELDPTDKIGAKLLIEIAAREGREDGDE